MRKYASETKFGGQRASVGRVVIEASGGPTPMTITRISQDDELFSVILGNTGEQPLGEFVDAKTEVDVHAMRDGQWCWPPRV